MCVFEEVGVQRPNHAFHPQLITQQQPTQTPPPQKKHTNARSPNLVELTVHPQEAVQLPLLHQLQLRRVPQLVVRPVVRAFVRSWYSLFGRSVDQAGQTASSARLTTTPRIPQHPHPHTPHPNPTPNQKPATALTWPPRAAAASRGTGASPPRAPGASPAPSPRRLRGNRTWAGRLHVRMCV